MSQEKELTPSLNELLLAPTAAIETILEVIPEYSVIM
jgi:hypothetical protein